jgi:hypothetical protein
MNKIITSEEEGMRDIALVEFFLREKTNDGRLVLAEEILRETKIRSDVCAMPGRIHKQQRTNKRTNERKIYAKTELTPELVASLDDSPVPRDVRL